MYRVFTTLSVCILLIVYGCTVPKEISDALLYRETNELLRNTAAEYIVQASIGENTQSEINKTTGLIIKNRMKTIKEKTIGIFGDKALVRQPEEGVLTVICSDYLFKSGSGELLDSSFETVKAFAEMLAENPEVFTYVLVHTDNIGSEYISLALSEQRAKTLKKVLRKAGVKKLHAEGKGSTVAVISNETEEGRKRNRRVEIAVVASPKLIKQTRKEVIHATKDLTRAYKKSLRQNKKNKTNNQT